MQLIPLTTRTACQRRRPGRARSSCFTRSFSRVHLCPDDHLCPPPQPPNLQFVREGMYQEQAELTRLNAKFGETEARKMVKREASAARASARADKLEREADPSAIPLGARLGIDASPAAAFDATAAARRRRRRPRRPTPSGGSTRAAPGATYADLRRGRRRPRRRRVRPHRRGRHHGVRRAPRADGAPVGAPPPPPQPLKLTKQEQRELRSVAWRASRRSRR